MAWVAEGVQVTVDWHVFAGGRWLVEAVPVGRTAPVNVYVAEDRMAPVEYRHQAGTCRGECRLVCGHTLPYGCDCDTIAAEADAQDTGGESAPVGDAAPVTYAGEAPADLVGRLVRVRPFYLTRDRHSTRARRTVPARVEEVFGSEMVIVVYTHHTGDAPWPMRQAYYPRELHHPHGQCLCPGCAGDGIREHHGA